MCSQLYSFCDDCKNFYPASERIKVKKRQCRDPNCNLITGKLLDQRHAKCKQIKKTGLLGKKEPKETLLPISEAMAEKLSRLKSGKGLRAENGRPQDGVRDPCESDGGNWTFFEIETGDEFWDGSSINDSKWLSKTNPWSNA